MQSMQLFLRFFKSAAETHEKAQWTETFQVQPMRCKFQMENFSFEACTNSHCSRLICELFLHFEILSFILESSLQKHTSGSIRKYKSQM